MDEVALRTFAFASKKKIEKKTKHFQENQN